MTIDGIVRDEVIATDLATASDTLRTIYGGRARLRATAGRPRYEVHSARAGDLAADRLQHTMHCRSEFEPNDRVMVTTVVGGSLSVTRGGHESRIPPGEVVLTPSDTAWSSEWSDFRGSTVHLPAAVVAHVAQTRHGVPADRFRFEGVTPVSAEMNRTWLAVNTFVHGQFERNSELVSNPLLRPMLQEYLAGVQLTVFPNSTMTSHYQRSAGEVGPVTLRRAVEYIEAHPGDPLTVETIAEAVGTGARALQLTFRRHLGTTPMGYLRSVRLRALHRDLAEADPDRGDTLSAIASRWGFRRTDRLLASYSEQFGETPQQTLHN